MNGPRADDSLRWALGLNSVPGSSWAARACASLRRMSFRQILPLAVLVTALLPASALAAPTVTVTGDDGNPAAAERGRARQHPQHGRRQPTSPSPRPTRATTRARSSIAAGAPASSLSTCRATRILARRRGTSPTTAATGPTPWSCATTTPHGDSDCNGAVTEQRFRYTINAGTAVTAPPRPAAHPRPELIHHEHVPARRRAEPRRVDLRGPLRPRRRRRPRRSDLRPLGRDVRRPHDRARGLPLRQARAAG